MDAKWPKNKELLVHIESFDYSWIEKHPFGYLRILFIASITENVDYEVF